MNIKRISRYELTVGLETPSRDIGHRISSSSKVAIRQAIALDVAMGVASEEKNRKLQLKYDDDIDIRASLNDRQSKYLKRLQKENKLLMEVLKIELAESKSKCDLLEGQLSDEKTVKTV